MAGKLSVCMTISVSGDRYFTEHFWTPVVTGGDTSPILQTAKHVLNPIAFLVSPFVVLDGPASRCPS